jgi:serine/threonine protein kinase
VQQGALKDILANHSTKLGYEKKMRLLQSAAMGVNHLHSLSPAIIHRDLKSSNLLVDENWNVKVADFGFARIKEENATMTRCGTPCWTAPEVLRGEKYSEAADVFSFGIVMWEVLTRRQPYAGLNFMAVTLDVLEGRRPPLPHDFPRGAHRRNNTHAHMTQHDTTNDTHAPTNGRRNRLQAVDQAVLAREP